MCIFCDIVAGQMPAKIVYEDDTTVAFHDKNPQAPIHILVVPREHVDGPLAVNEQNEAVIGHLVTVAATIAQQEGFATAGYRLVINQGQHGGQSVMHLHLHVLAGRRMGWPPG